MNKSLRIPVKVEKISDLDTLKKGQLITFTCRKCGKTVTRLFLRHRIKMIETFLCRECNYEETCNKRYGCTNVAKATSIKEKIQKTNLEKYGNVCSLNGKEQIIKKKETWKKKYGVENPYQREEVKNKVKENNLKKFGKECPLGLFNEKALETRLRKYGTLRTLSYKYTYDDLKFDSWWEVCFYIYNKDNGKTIEREPFSISYLKNNSECKYYVDFKIDNSLYEIKSKYLISRTSKEKIDCMKANNVILISDDEIIPYLNYVSQKYPTLKETIEKLKSKSY